MRKASTDSTTKDLDTYWEPWTPDPYYTWDPNYPNTYKRSIEDILMSIENLLKKILEKLERNE